MKRKTLYMFLALIVLISVISCAQQTPQVKKEKPGFKEVVQEEYEKINQLSVVMEIVNLQEFEDIKNDFLEAFLEFKKFKKKFIKRFKRFAKSNRKDIDKLCDKYNITFKQLKQAIDLHLEKLKKPKKIF